MTQLEFFARSSVSCGQHFALKHGEDAFGLIPSYLYPLQSHPLVSWLLAHAPRPGPATEVFIRHHGPYHGGKTVRLGHICGPIVWRFCSAARVTLRRLFNRTERKVRSS
jgi:hypothetical protein